MLPKGVHLPSTNPQLIIENPKVVLESATNIRILKELSNLF